MAQTILNFGGSSALRWLYDDVAATLSLQIWNSGTSAWDTALTLNTATTSEELTVAKLFTVSGGITGSGNTGALQAGSGILGTANTWSALQTFGSGTSDSTLSYAALGSAATTTSTTFVSAGLGVSVTPAGTRALVRTAFVASNNTAGDGVQVAIYQSTAGIPAAGSAPASGDTSVYNSGSLVSTAANQQQAGAAELLLTGLTAGTKYYWYVAFEAVTGGTAALAGGSAQTSILAQGA